MYFAIHIFAYFSIYQILKSFVPATMLREN